ncbi:hypothetical protein BHQ21_25365 [Mycobacterium sherrisii]|uniref:Uncharacterized protein n=1 Tax=Mycobacterium sherrisii TaxID=243061 RepID=A0A1E3SCJ2_9MYCO|nr:hypothetical protein BHQ21_25365 [Mycobacterium sherrisii]
MAVDIGLLAAGSRLVTLSAIVGTPQSLAFPFGRRTLALVGELLAFVRQLFAIIGNPVTLVGDPVPAAEQEITSLDFGLPQLEVVIALVQGSRPVIEWTGRLGAVVADHTTL